MRSARAAIRNVSRLAWGYVSHSDSVWSAVTILVLSLAARSAGPWLIDLARSGCAAGPITGLFFQSPEVVRLPVPRRQMWIARWLLGTAGAMVVITLTRLAGFVLLRSFDAAYLARLVVVDAFGVCVIAGLGAFQLQLQAIRVPARVRFTSSLVRLVALFSSPWWSTYARGLVATGARAPMLLMGATIVMFVGGFLVQPPRIESLRASRARIRSLADLRWTASDEDTPGNGASRWVMSRLRLAVACGLGPVVIVSAAALWFPPPENASLQVGQRLTGDLGLSGQFTLLCVSVATVISASAVRGGLRFLRLLPLRRSVIAATLTGGLLASFSSSLALLALVDAIWSRSWSVPFNLAAALGALTAVAAAKTVALTSARGRIAIFFVFIPALGATVALWRELTAVPAIAVTTCLLLLLMRLDANLLATQSGLYRGAAATT